MWESKLVRGMVLLVVATALGFVSLSHTGLALQIWSLGDGEHLVEAVGERVDRRGWGPWRRDVVRLPTLDRSVEVPSVPSRAPHDTVTVLVEPDAMSGVGRHVDAPPREAWVPFAWSGGLMALGGVGLLLLGLRPLAEAVFDQRDPAARPVSWTPGSGTHGGGAGQVPPHVPYDPDWDPRNRRGR